MSGRAPRVIVVGAGPVGLAIALTLARAGVGVTVMERRDTLTSDSRAATFHPATLDLLAELGVAHALIAGGTLVDRLQWRNRRGHMLAEMHMNLLEGRTGHPFRLHAEQNTLITLLAADLARFPGAQLRLAAAVDAVTDTGSRVRVRTGAGWEAGDYVVAADGAHSTIRSVLGVRFAATPYPTQAVRVLTDSPLADLLPGLAPLTYVRDPVASCSLLQLPDHWRIILRRPPGAGANPYGDEVAALVRRALAVHGQKLTIIAAHTYGLARGVLASFRHGRALFVGDAAHVTTTAGGLNMNAGIAEAVALGGVLAAVLGGAVPVAALDGWAEDSRRILLEVVIPRSEARVAGVQDGDRVQLRAAVARLRATAADPAAARAYLAKASLLDILPQPTPSRSWS